ncbi:MAG: hypothetical protein M1832_001775 [Thelocarpon impressellum]|nr:MAG: hypothetical protein M1832_001775 [Thelocarpon impressellum]
MDLSESIPGSSAKRQKTNAGPVLNTQASYNSEDDSGDEIFEGYETIATVPVERPSLISQSIATQRPSSPSDHITQPTQILDRAAKQRDDEDRKISTVQVVASSPLRASPAISSTMVRKPATGGVLASAMAPPGTAFRAPYGVQKAPPRVIDISDDDDGPTYQGDSSDEETLATRKLDIKPSTFAKSGGSAGRKDGTDERIEESPGAAVNKFKEITSNSFYKPLEKGKTMGSALSGSIFDSRNRNGGVTSSSFAGAAPAKRSADTTAGASAGPSAKRAKQARQSGPERARAMEDINLDGITDLQLREKVSRMKRVLPSLTFLVCRNALLEKRGNFDDAMELVTSDEPHPDHVDLTLSDGEGATADQAGRPAKPTAKRQVKAPNRTIQDKYSSTQALPLPSPGKSLGTSTPPKKPRKRLVQGRKAPLSPAVEASKALTSRVHTPDSVDDDSDSAVEIASADDGELEGKVLDFFNTCSVKDLADISSNTEEVAQVILAQRPFASLNDVRQISSEMPPVTKTGKRKTTKKPIGEKIVDSCLDMWTGYEAVDDLVAKCEGMGKPVAEEMKKWGFDVFGAAKNGELEMVSLDEASSSLRDSGIGTPTSSPPTPKDDEAEGIVGLSGPARKKRNSFLAQPSSMAEGTVLKDYQLVGLNWLALLFEKELSCILADEMGLGKTCQVIAFLAHLLEKGVTGPHLIVVPGSTLENWLRECKRFCPALVVEPYYGLEKDRADIRMKIEGNIDRINVIITTYDLASKKVDSKFLRHLRPTVCVYDEGHALKNSSSLRYAALMRIPAKFRLLLTGTPLQNNLKELAALLGFILPSVFNERRGDLEFIFKHKARTTDSNHDALLSGQRIARAKSMMTPFVLRRKKHQVLKHLPPKTSRVEFCELTPAQREVYEHEVRQAREAMEARAAGNKPDKESSNVMMQLRKAAIHPMLFRRIFDDDTIRKMSRDCLGEAELSDRDPDMVYEDMGYYSDFQLHTFCEEHPRTMRKYNIKGDEWMDSGKVEKLAELLLRFRSQGDRVLVFSQFTMVLNILEAVMETLQMQFFRFDGSTKIEERQDMIDQFYAEKDITVFLLSTKAGGMGINLACANKVVIFDQSFNPQEDMQAENRAHRVGQQRPVEVIRLVTRGTIEEQIHALGETKLALDERVSGEAAGGEKEVKAAEEEGMGMVRDMWLKSKGEGKREGRG